MQQNKRALKDRAAEDSFYGLKPNKEIVRKLPAEIDEENVNWTKIKPNRNYSLVKQQYYNNEKKRKFEEFKRQKQETDASKIGVGMNMYYNGNGKRKFWNNKGGPQG